MGCWRAALGLSHFSLLGSEVVVGRFSIIGSAAKLGRGGGAMSTDSSDIAGSEEVARRNDLREEQVSIEMGTSKAIARQIAVDGVSDECVVGSSAVAV